LKAVIHRRKPKTDWKAVRHDLACLLAMEAKGLSVGLLASTFWIAFTLPFLLESIKPPYSWANLAGGMMFAVPIFCLYGFGKKCQRILEQRKAQELNGIDPELISR
jgi:hypothetical protein